MMTVMQAPNQDRTASDELRRELDLALAELPPSAGPSRCGIAAITVAPQTGEVLVVCVCALLGRGHDEDAARADLADAHREADRD